MFSSVGGGVDTIRAWVDRIRMSADSLIAPADTLIVVKASIRIAGIYE